ncbi:cytochrome c551 [Neobacillus pocheonensis]|uniref:cytochrome c551 n=1 Tax=Neobacillus pocheonensis TaxID=363869 RepID=UPI003D2CDBFA
MKKKLLTLLLGTSMVMGLAACGGGSDDAKDTASGGEAAKIFDQKCSSCHGGDLKGGMGPNLTKVGSKYSKDEILDILKNGKSGGMPANVVEGDDAETVAAWLADKK